MSTIFFDVRWYFYAALSRDDSGDVATEGPAGCDSDKCMMPEKKGA